MKWVKNICFLVIVSMLSVIATPASAVPTVERLPRPSAAVEIVEVRDSFAAVRSSEGVVEARYDAVTGTVTATQPDGTKVRVDARGLDTQLRESSAPARPDSLTNGRERTQANSFTCAMALHVVGLIHSYGWATAAALALAAGATGAAVVSFVMLVGVDVFLVWVSTRC